MENIFYWIQEDYKRTNYWSLLTAETNEDYYEGFDPGHFFLEGNILEKERVFNLYNQDRGLNNEPIRIGLANSWVPILNGELSFEFDKLIDEGKINAQLIKVENIFKNFEKYCESDKTKPTQDSFIDLGNKKYFILNILDIVDCLNYKKSKPRWSRNKKGEKVIVGGKWFIDVNEEREYPHIFRMKYSEQIIIISDLIKNLLDSYGVDEVYYTDIRVLA